jgi:hypothetical protein
MNDTISVWGVAIPSLLSTALGGLVAYYVTHQLTKDIEAIKSRLHREEEAFRLAHSPRVTAAIKLWTTFCEFERAMGAALNPMSPYYVAKDVEAKVTDPVLRAQQEARIKAIEAGVANAWATLKGARDEAECLIDAATFDAFNVLFGQYDSAYGGVWLARTMVDAVGPMVQAAIQTINILEAAKSQRLVVVAAMRRAIAGEGDRDAQAAT